jgi:hypothetical protein
MNHNMDLVPAASRNLYTSLVELLASQGYPDYYPENEGGARLSSSGNFMVYRQLPGTNHFRFYSYNAVAQELVQKDVRSRRAKWKYDEKICEQLGF